MESRPKWMLNEFIINNLNSGCQWYKVRENKKSHRGTLTLLFDSSRPSLMQTLTVFVWWWLTAQTARVEASTHHTTLDATIQIRVRPWNRMPIFYCVHRIANSLLLDVYTIQQTSRKNSSKCIQIHMNCWTFAGSCKHPRAIRLRYCLKPILFS